MIVYLLFIAVAWNIFASFVCKLCVRAYLCTYKNAKAMSKKVTIKIVLDTRRAKISGLFPVKIRVTFQREQKYFPVYAPGTVSYTHLTLPTSDLV